MLPSEKRRDLFGAIQRLASLARSGAYLVHRGPIDWATFDFSGPKARAIAVMTAAGPFATVRGETPVVVVLQGAARLGTIGDGGNGSVDDGLQGELLDDLEGVVYDLLQEKNAVGDTVAFPWNQETWTHHGWFDASKHVQGITATFMVNLV